MLMFLRVGLATAATQHVMYVQQDTLTLDAASALSQAAAAAASSP